MSRKALLVMADGLTHTTAEIEAKTGVNRAHVSSYFCRKVEQGLVERVNPGRKPTLFRLTAAGLESVAPKRPTQPTTLQVAMSSRLPLETVWGARP